MLGMSWSMSTGMGELGLVAVVSLDAAGVHQTMGWRNCHHTLKGDC